MHRQQAKEGFACAFTGSGVVLSGGNVGPVKNTRSTFFYDTNTSTWSQLGFMTVGRAQHKLAYMKVSSIPHCSLLFTPSSPPPLCCCSFCFYREWRTPANKITLFPIQFTFIRHNVFLCV